MTTLQTIFIAYLVLANLVAFAMYGIDKKRAIKNKWRIPEKTLLLAALFGGAMGALWGMILFHHKTKKAKFFLIVPVLFFLQILLVFWLFQRFGLLP